MWVCLSLGVGTTQTTHPCWANSLVPYLGSILLPVTVEGWVAGLVQKEGCDVLFTGPVAGKFRQTQAHTMIH